MSVVPIPTRVVKVGGSLFDHPNLGQALRQWLREQTGARHLIVPGGGALADVIRDYHRRHGASEEDCHWMAIQAMAINASLIRSLLTEKTMSVVDALEFCRDDERRPAALPHDWRVTSDSIAARVAEVTGADRLVLLKSTDLPEGIDWPAAAERGLVDVMFPEVVARAGLTVEWVHFRRRIGSPIV